MPLPPATATTRLSRWFAPALLGLGYALYDLGLWLGAWRTAEGDFRVAQAAFRARMLFPSLGAEGAAALVASVISLICAVLARRRSTGRGRSAALTVAAAAALLCLWNLWALM